MGNFYGNIMDTNKVQFYFDKMYPTKKSLMENATSDGIYLNRYVLVEYSINPFKDEKLINLNKTDNQSPKDGIAYKEFFTADLGQTQSGMGIHLYLYENTKIIKTATYEIKNQDDITELYHKVNYQIDKWTYFDNKENDPNFMRGFDSTVWQKIFIGNDKSIPSYINIADLNAIVPNFSLLYDLPSDSATAPRIDAEKSSLLNYAIRVQPSWDMQVKYATDKEHSDENDSTHRLSIYYNKNGFNKQNANKDNNTINKIAIEDGESRSRNIKYDITSKQDILDAKELSINLPIIGNAISELWDIIYGVGNSANKNKRDSIVNWDTKITNIETPIVNIASYDLNKMYPYGNDLYYLQPNYNENKTIKSYKWQPFSQSSVVQIIMSLIRMIGANDPNNLDKATFNGTLNFIQKLIGTKNDEAGTETLYGIIKLIGTTKDTLENKTIYGILNEATKLIGTSTDTLENGKKTMYSVYNLIGTSTDTLENGEKTIYSAYNLIGTIKDTIKDKTMYGAYKSVKDLIGPEITSDFSGPGTTINEAIYLANKAADRANQTTVLWEKF